MAQCRQQLEILWNSATELNKEAFLPVTDESFPPHLSGLEKINPLGVISCSVASFPLTGCRLKDTCWARETAAEK